MFLTLPLTFLALLSLGLGLWQWTVTWRFRLHHRDEELAAAPPVTVLKPLKGCDPETAACLESWLKQTYPAPVQFLFGVASAQDPVGDLVRQLLTRYPEADAQLVVCPEPLGPNAKVSTLIQLEPLIKHETLVISDADVWVPTDLLRQVVSPLADSKVGLVNCFYQIANPANVAMRWEAIAVNADFWSQVLQARSLKPLDFALGAVMATTQTQLKPIGGFASLVDYLADDYQLGQRVAATGACIELCPVVVECRSVPMGWREVWSHQLRWARTIRACQPVPYFFSILSNGTIWPLAWWAVGQTYPFHWPNFLQFQRASVEVLSQPVAGSWLALGLGVCLLVRILTALHLEARLTRSSAHVRYFGLVPIKDLLQFLIWGLAFIGNRVVWRGERFQILAGGKLIKPDRGLPWRS